MNFRKMRSIIKKLVLSAFILVTISSNGQDSKTKYRDIADSFVLQYKDLSLEESTEKFVNDMEYLQQILPKLSLVNDTTLQTNTYPLAEEQAHLSSFFLLNNNTIDSILKNITEVKQIAPGLFGDSIALALQLYSPILDEQVKLSTTIEKIYYPDGTVEEINEPFTGIITLDKEIATDSVLLRIDYAFPSSLDTIVIYPKERDKNSDTISILNSRENAIRIQVPQELHEKIIYATAQTPDNNLVKPVFFSSVRGSSEEQLLLRRLTSIVEKAKTNSYNTKEDFLEAISQNLRESELLATKIYMNYYFEFYGSIEKIYLSLVREKTDGHISLTLPTSKN